jgi:hypothetical protein
MCNYHYLNIKTNFIYKNIEIQNIMRIIFYPIILIRSGNRDQMPRGKST